MLESIFYINYINYSMNLKSQLFLINKTGGSTSILNRPIKLNTSANFQVQQ